MELVRRDVRGSTPGWASSRGRFFGPCFTSRPPSRDVIQPERYTARSTNRRLRFRLGTIYTQVCAYAKNKACAPRSPRRRERFTPSWPPLSPSSLTWRGAFFVQRIVHPPYAAHNSSANNFHRTELFSHGIRLNPLFSSSSLVAWWIDTSWGLLLSLLTRIYLHFDFNCWYPSSLYTGYVRSNKN